MSKTCLEKQGKIKELFSRCSDRHAKYLKLIELGKAKNSLDPMFKTKENLVNGCQSTMYLKSFLENGLVKFYFESDAIVSAGLAAILAEVYSGELPETVLQCPPSYLEELGIEASLTPGRANGLYSIHLKMKQDALKFLLNATRPEA